MVAYVEKMKLIRSSANCVGKEQDITLEPCYFLRRVFETNTGTRHDEELSGFYPTYREIKIVNQK